MKHKYQGLKVSKLSSPFNRKIAAGAWNKEHIEHSLAHVTSRMKPIEPVFNRYGWYHDRNTRRTWVESEHGCWEEDSSVGFFESFEAYGFEDLLPAKVSSAIKLLAKHNMCPKELEKKLYKDLAVRYFRKDKYKLRKRLKNMHLSTRG